MRLARPLVDLLLPPRCPACAGPATAVWCGRCLAELAALALPDQGRVLLAPGVLSLAAYAYEGVVRSTLLEVKVRGRRAALEGMAALLRARLGLRAQGGRHAVTWVPAHPGSVRRRGVDVARVLAGPGARPLLRRVRRTADQKRLGARERRHSQRGAFSATGPVPPAVVVVDDVRTTGATALEAARALRAGGAERVVAVAFAAVSAPSGRAARPPRAAGGRARWW